MSIKRGGDPVVDLRLFHQYLRKSMGHKQIVLYNAAKSSGISTFFHKAKQWAATGGLAWWLISIFYLKVFP